MMLLLCFVGENYGLVQLQQLFLQINVPYRSDLYGPCNLQQFILETVRYHAGEAQKEDLHSGFYFHFIQGKLSPRKLNKLSESHRALGRKRNSTQALHVLS